MKTAAFQWPVRVYYEDTDAGGVVYHANALRFMERARTEWLRALGHEQDALRERDRVLLVVQSMRIDWRLPLRFNASLQVSCEIRRVDRARVLLEQVILVADETDAAAAGRLAVMADVTVACVDAGRFRPVRWPASLAATLAGEAATAPVTAPRPG